MRPTLCSRCKKNYAVIFITKIENGETKNEGLCLKCAKELGIKPVDDMMQKLGITDEDLENLTGEMMGALGGEEMIPTDDDDAPDDEEDGRTATFPFLSKLSGNMDRQKPEQPKDGKEPKKGGKKDSQPPPEEQSLPDRRARRWQNRHCRGTCPADRGRQGAL